MSEPTFESAMAILGIDLEAGGKGARRAYLRQLKQTKPERDPEGFMRLREAYELVKEEIGWRAEPDDWDDEEDEDDLDCDCEGEGESQSEGKGDKPKDAPHEAGDSQEDSDTDASVLVLPMGARVSVSDWSTTSAVDEADDEVDLDDYNEQLYNLDDDAPAEAHLAIAREVLQKHPDSEAAHQFFVSVFSDEDLDELPGRSTAEARQQELVVVLRQALERGWDDFFDWLVESAPEYLNDEDLLRAEARTEPAFRMSLVFAMLTRHDFAQAKRLALEVIDVLDGPDPSDSFLLWRLHHLTLSLLRHGGLAEGLEVGTRTLALSQNTGDELRVAVGDVEWLLFDELVGVIPLLSPKLTPALAYVLQQWSEGEHGDAEHAIRDMVLRNPNEAIDALSRLEDRAPNLATIISDVVDNTPNIEQLAPAAEQSSGYAWPLWIGALITLGLMKAFLSQVNPDCRCSVEPPNTTSSVSQKPGPKAADACRPVAPKDPAKQLELLDNDLTAYPSWPDPMGSSSLPATRLELRWLMDRARAVHCHTGGK